MENSPLWARCMAQLKKHKWLEILVYVVLVGGIALVYFSGNTPKTTGQNPQTTPLAQAQSQDLEERLKHALENIRGAGRVEVMITYDSGPELVPAMSSERQSNTTRDTRADSEGETQSVSESDKPMTLNKSGSDEPLVLVEMEPKVRGVIVMAEGAGDIRVRMDLMRAVTTVLGVDAGRIEVFAMGERAEQ